MSGSHESDDLPGCSQIGPLVQIRISTNIENVNSSCCVAVETVKVPFKVTGAVIDVATDGEDD